MVRNLCDKNHILAGIKSSEDWVGIMGVQHTIPLALLINVGKPSGLWGLFTISPILLLVIDFSTILFVFLVESALMRQNQVLHS